MEETMKKNERISGQGQTPEPPRKPKIMPGAIPLKPKAMELDDILGELSGDGATAEEKALAKKMSKKRTPVGGRKTILVVDDDSRMLNVIKQHLEDLYDVAIVPSGKLALKYLSKKHADIVLLDYLMPEMEGPEVLKEIRNGDACPDIPVVFLTGVADRDKVMKGLGYRPAGYLLKPVSKEKLLEKVTEVLLEL